MKKLIKRVFDVVKKVIKAFFLMLYLIFVFSLVIGGIYAGIWTLIPTESIGWGATKECYLGYIAHCSFTPYSTLILFAMALIGSILLIHLMKYFNRNLKVFLQKKLKREKSIIH